MDDDKTPPPPPSEGGWWFAWIFATIIIPGSALSLLSLSGADKNVAQVIVSLLAVGGVAVCLQVVSSIKLGSNRSSAMTALLMFGGWLLMAVSFFAGCLVMAGLS